MTDEPYRWLEAVGNRREYIRDRMKGATPVFACSRPQGVLLIGAGQGQSKVFEVYNRQGLAAFGHPVDIEKLRQAAIEVAHVEGFNRSSHDVTLRRLINFSISMTLKNNFEQIYAPPWIVESIFAEVGTGPGEDLLARVHFDGSFQYSTSGVLVAHTAPLAEQEASDWLLSSLRPEDSLGRVAHVCLTAWRELMQERPFSRPDIPEQVDLSLDGRVVEMALLDRTPRGLSHYRTLAPEDLAGS